MLTTKETIDNLDTTEKIILGLVDKIRAVNVHVLGMTAPPEPEQVKGEPIPANGFVNQVNDRNKNIGLAVFRALTEINFLDRTLKGEPEQPEGKKEYHSPVIHKGMPKADTSSLESELAESLDANS